jgi:hypothetical protein
VQFDVPFVRIRRTDECSMSICVEIFLRTKITEISSIITSRESKVTWKHLLARFIFSIGLGERNSQDDASDGKKRLLSHFATRHKI